MAIKVVFPIGTTSISVGGLFQWDYGQVLEIESSEIGSEIVEVHFACPSMSEAIVRPCTFSNGVGTVTIPDQCLEQTNTITAWIFEIDGTQGHTAKTITLPLTARKRPAKSRDIPAEYVDKYAEALTEINEAIDALESGEIVVAKATQAENATTATSADSASNAAYATTANNANLASMAARANVANALAVTKTATCTLTNGAGTVPSAVTHGAFYLITLYTISCLCYIDSEGYGYAALGIYQLSIEEGSVQVSVTGASDSRLDSAVLNFYRLGSIS